MDNFGINADLVVLLSLGSSKEFENEIRIHPARSMLAQNDI